MAFVSVGVRASFLACSVAFLAGALTTGTEASQPFGVQDLVRLERISEPVASPDGRQVAYTLRTADMDANKGRTSVWLFDARNPEQPAIRLTDMAANADSAEWSADGRYVYYLSNRSGSGQVWRSDAVRHDSVQITNLPLDVGSFRVSPKLDRLLVSLEVFPDCADLACTQKRLDTMVHTSASGRLYDQLFVRHWDTWSDGRRSQLFAIALGGTGLANGTPLKLSGNIGDVPGKPFGGREDYAFSPDGATVAFSVRAAAVGEPWSTNFDIYQVAAGGGTPRNLTADNPAWDGQPAFSPDGATLAYVAMSRPGFEADRFQLMLLDLKSGVKHALAPGWDRSITSFEWAPDGKSILATADHLGQRPLWSLDVKTGRLVAITGDGEVEGFTVARKQVFFTRSDLAHPADLYVVAPGIKNAQTPATVSSATTAMPATDAQPAANAQSLARTQPGADARLPPYPPPVTKPRQLTHLNQATLAQRAMSGYEQFSFPGWNHEKVYGYLVKPADFKSDGTYPLALVVHGGPQGSLGNVWHWRWNAETLAGAGYAVVMIDFHGSTGYGQAFTDSISGDWGGKPLEDLKLGLAAALQLYPWLDGNRMCALGGSYGGYMMNWIAGQWPDRFKCIVTHDGIFDNRSMYYSTEELWFPEWENGGPEYANPAGYARHNPVDYVNRWKTPTLVIHGQLDYRVPYAQGLAVYTALQRRGIPSELLYFPDENHWVLKPANSVQWYDTTIAWMDRWTRP